MSTPEDRKIEALEEILLSYANTIDEKIIVTNMANNNATVKDYVLALADGLKYGNWPWITYNRQTRLLRAAMLSPEQLKEHCTCGALSVVLKGSKLPLDSNDYNDCPVHKDVK